MYGYSSSLYQYDLNKQMAQKSNEIRFFYIASLNYKLYLSTINNKFKTFNYFGNNSRNF